MNEPGFLGTGATLSRDLTLIAYVFLLVPSMLIGYVFAKRKMFVPHHKMMMTGIMIFNWVLITLVMFISYRDYVAPNVPDGLNETFNLLPTLHLLTGAASQILATYLVFRMWFEKVLPQWIMVKNIKRYMRITLALWLTTALLGALIYLVWYVQPADASESQIAPVSTEEAVSPEATDADVTPESTDASIMPEATEPIMTEEATMPLATDEADEPVETEEADEPAETEEADDPVETEEADDDEVDEPAETEEAEEPVATEEATSTARPTRTTRPTRTPQATSTPRP
ncbi:MAG: hypothetical protein H7Y09_00970 [Chitinophagaceae bacterium]|nr:hypothetical protein [Anaerolineae bacterium]